MTENFKPTGTTGFFGEEFRLEKLSKQGDPLEKLNPGYSGLECVFTYL